MATLITRSRRGFLLTVFVLLGAFAAGCTEGATFSTRDSASGSGSPIEVEPPRTRDRDGLLETRALQEIVEHQLRRDGAALVEKLDSESALIRGRAAFALGSVQWAGAAGALEALLSDPEPRVRADAAFALGQIPPAEPGAALLRALTDEREPQVRLRLVEALGKAGDAGSIEGLLAPPGDPAVGPEEEAARALAVGRALIRGIEVPGGVSALGALLQHENAAVREAAAWYFGRSPDSAGWSDQVGAMRSALDEAASDDPAAMHLLLALARHRSADDRERLLHWLGNSGDWRNRANAARGLGHVAWIEREGVREGLFDALNDPVEQVAILAARSLTQGLWVPPAVLTRMEERLREDPAERWRVHVPFLRQITLFGEPQAVVAWTRRAMDVHPLAVAAGLAALAEAHVPDLEPLVLQALGHAEPEYRTVGVSALTRSPDGLLLGHMDLEAIRPHLQNALMEGSGPAAAYAASVLAHPAFLEFGTSEDALHDAGWTRLERGEVHVSGVLARALIGLGDARGDALASAVEEATVDLAPDWAYLASLGAYPRLHLETNRGDIVVRLAASEAPLTVQGLARLAADGRHDGLPFHRLEPNFVVQGGDVAMSDGSGFPGFRLPSEFTSIPFRRGTVGMASLGKDTEGSQFFLAHSKQPHLDGAFTSFGWVESGFEVMDRLGVGDRVIRMRVEPDPGADG